MCFERLSASWISRSSESVTNSTCAVAHVPAILPARGPTGTPVQSARQHVLLDGSFFALCMEKRKQNERITVREYVKRLLKAKYVDCVTPASTEQRKASHVDIQGEGPA